MLSGAQECCCTIAGRDQELFNQYSTLLAILSQVGPLSRARDALGTLLCTIHDLSIQRAASTVYDSALVSNATKVFSLAAVRSSNNICKQARQLSFKDGESGSQMVRGCCGS
jgi:hypothetical protein